MSLIGASDPRLAGAPTAFEAPRLAVTRLVLTNFRSYASGALAVSGRPVVLAGPNGAGKTNILDALSLLSPGRGLRGATLGEHARKGPAVPGEALWAVAATVAQHEQAYEIGTGLTLGPNGGERRKVHLNGAPSNNAADLADVVQMAWLTPAMDRLFIEGASERRRFLDRLVFGFEPGHARIATRYETAMRERARLLKFGPRDPAWLDGLEADMTETGIALSVSRAQTVERLNRALTARGEAGAFPCAQLALTGEADTRCGHSNPTRRPKSANISPAPACAMRKQGARPSARTAAIFRCATPSSVPTPPNARRANRRRFSSPSCLHMPGSFPI